RRTGRGGRRQRAWWTWRKTIARLPHPRRRATKSPHVKAPPLLLSLWRCRGFLVPVVVALAAGSRGDRAGQLPGPREPVPGDGPHSDHSAAHRAADDARLHLRTVRLLRAQPGSAGGLRVDPRAARERKTAAAAPHRLRLSGAAPLPRPSARRPASA